MPDPSDWLLTKPERGNPATRLDDAAPRRAGLVGGQPGPAADPRRDVLRRAVRTDRGHPGRRPGLLHRLAGRRRRAAHRRAGQRGRRGARPRRRARGRRPRAGLALAHGAPSASPPTRTCRLGRALQKRGAEAILDMRVRTGGSPPPEAASSSGTATTRPATSPTSAASTCATRVATTPTHGGDPQALDNMAEEYGDTPPWHDIQAAISGPAVHDVETVFRERWEDPTHAEPQPGHPAPGPAPRPRHHARPAARAGAAAAAGRRRHPRRPAAAHLSRTCAMGATTRSPAAASAASPAATPRPSTRARRLIYVEDQYLWGDHVGEHLHRGAARAPRPARDRGGADAPGRRRGSAGPPSCWAGGARCSTWRGSRPTGSRSTASRTTRARRSTCTPRPASSTTPGRRSAPTTSTAARGPTTPSSRPSWSTPPVTTPGGCGSPWPPSTSTAMTPTTTWRTASSRPGCSRRTPSAPRAWTAGTPAGEVGPRPPGRLRRLDPPELGRLTRAIALAPYLFLHDPDGRPKPLRKKDEF